MENSGVFNRQWKLRPIGSYHISALSTLSSPKLSQAHAWIPKAKNGWETTEKRQTIVLKWLVKQRKHYLSLARRSFTKRENIKRKREVGNIRRKREVSGQNGRVGISVYIGSDRSNISQSFTRPLRREPAINMAGSNFLDWCKKYCGVGCMVMERKAQLKHMCKKTFLKEISSIFLNEILKRERY